MKNLSLSLRLLLLLALGRWDPVSAATLYVATRAGSLYSSSDGAKTWQQIPIAGAPTASYNATLAIDPQNPGAIYVTLVGTSGGASKGSPNGPQPLQSLFRSADGGQSWSQTPGILPSHLTVDPTSPNIVYADSPQGFVRSPDSGATFGSSTLNLGITGIGVDPRQAGVVYATSVDNARSVVVYKSSDYGSTWTSLGNPDGKTNANVVAHDVAVDPRNSSVLYLPVSGLCPTSTTNCGLARTADGGKTWELVNLPGTFNNVVFDSRSGAIYAAGVTVKSTGQVVRSVDGGKTWTSLSTGLPAYAVKVFLDPNVSTTLYAAPDPNRAAGIFVSTNSGASWTLSPAAPPGDLVETMAVASGTPAVSTLNMVSTATLLAGPLAPDSLATALGAGLASTLGATTVSILDSAGGDWPASLISVSPARIDYLVPAGVASGPATVVVAPMGGPPQSARIQIAPVAPALFTLNDSGLVKATLQRVSGDQQSSEDVFQVDDSGAVVARPIDLGPDTDQLFLTIIGTGFRAAGTSQTSVSIGGVDAPVSFAGAQDSPPGIDQATVLLPRSLAGAGPVSLVLTAAGVAANTVSISFQ